MTAGDIPPFPPNEDPAGYLLARLRQMPESRADLVDVGLDALAQRPLRDSVPVPWVARTLHTGLVACAASNDLESWLEGHVSRAMRRAEDVRGVLGDHIPMTVLAPMERALSRELHPDPRLVRALLDHTSFRNLAAAILHAQLLEFAHRIKSMVPGKPKSGGRGLASAFAGVAMGVASAVTSEVERQLEDKVTSFVKDAIGRVVDGTVDHICDPARADEMAEWRVDILRSFMTYPLEDLAAERHKYPPRALAEDIAGVLRAMAHWKQLPEYIERFVAEAYEDWGDMSLEAFLDGSGLESRWRDDAAELALGHLEHLVHADAFESWLRAQFQAGSPP